MKKSILKTLIAIMAIIPLAGKSLSQTVIISTPSGTYGQVATAPITEATGEGIIGKLLSGTYVNPYTIQLSPASGTLKVNATDPMTEATGQALAAAIGSGGGSSIVTGSGNITNSGTTTLSGTGNRITLVSGTTHITLAGSGTMSPGGGSTPNLSQVLTQGNDGGAIKISNIGEPVSLQDAMTLNYWTQTPAPKSILVYNGRTAGYDNPGSADWSGLGGIIDNSVNATNATNVWNPNSSAFQIAGSGDWSGLGGVIDHANAAAVSNQATYVWNTNTNTYELAGQSNWTGLGGTIDYAVSASSAGSINGVTPAPDGTYTVGIGVTQNGTITIQSGIITAVQEAQ